MSHYHRPKYGARKDENHAQIMRELGQLVGSWAHVCADDGSNLPAYTGYCQGVPFLIVDTSQAGGLVLDTRVYVGEIARDVEIKQPGKENDLTEGEKLYFALSEKTGRIVTTAEEYYAVICEMIEQNSGVL